MKEYTFILNFGCLTPIKALYDFKSFLDKKSILHRLHNPDTNSCQFVFKRISGREYKSVRKYFYDNLHIKDALFDVNDIMFMSFDNYDNSIKTRRLSYDKV